MRRILAIYFFYIIANGLIGCSTEAKASEEPDIQCKILNAWDFKRCENSEVICYTNKDGLSCKWKE